MVVVQGQPGRTDHLVEAVQLAEVRHWKKRRDLIDLIDISNLIFVYTKTITSGSFNGIK